MAEARVGSGKVALFCQEAPGGITYRIPALLYLPQESIFLAFAEKRSSFRDEDAEFLVMRRGHKEGMSVQVAFLKKLKVDYTVYIYGSDGEPMARVPQPARRALSVGT